MTRGIQALLINAYDPNNGKGGELYATYSKLLRSLLGPESTIIEKNADDLQDYAFDWEHELLIEETKSIAKRFDKVDIVFLSGDSNTLPWDKRMHDLTVLLHMCNFVKKPVVYSGGGAFHAMYALCTKGLRFDIINGPYGNGLDRLPTYGFYSNGSEVHPSGWLDSDTGDIYCFEKKRVSWVPRVCVGITRLPTHGAPPSESLKQPVKRHASDDRRLNEQEDIQAMDKGEDVITVRSTAQKHYLMHKLPFPKFVLNIPMGWHLNTEGGLPSDAGLLVLADGRNGPVILTFDNSLIVAAEVRMGKSYNFYRQLLKNFVRSAIERFQGEVPNGTRASRFTEQLFGSVGDALWEPSAVAKQLAPTLASSMVPSVLSTGPHKVASMYSPRPNAPKDVVVQPGAGDHFDYTALLSPRPHTTMGKKTPVAKKNPIQVRTKRLDIFLSSQGHPEMQPLNQKAALLAQKGQETVPAANRVPDTARVIFGERLLKPPVPQQEEFFRDTRQNHPPHVRFDRPSSSRRWKNGIDNFVDPNPSDDHLLGKYGIDFRESLDHKLTQSRPATAEHVQEKEDHHKDVTYIPRQHPARKVRIPELVDRKGNKIPQIPQVQRTATPTGDVNLTLGEHPGGRGTSNVAFPVVHIQVPRDPFTNHSKFQEMIRADAIATQENKKFEGTYTQQYRSEHELKIHEYTEAKKKFLGAPFRGIFGKASAIPLRPRSVIGPDSSYPNMPLNSGGMTAVDWNLFADDMKKHIGQKWR